MRTVIRVFIPIGLAVFFLFAGVSKLLDPVEFSRSIGRYEILDHPWTLAAALWLPWTETFAAMALFFKRWRQAGVVILLVLLLIFEVILAITWMRGLNIDCGCLGGGMDTSVAFAFFRNIGLFTLAIVLYISIRTENEPSQ
jgi:hypothetical protein